MGTRKQNIRHARQRAKERYALDLTIREHEFIVKQIRDAHAWLIYRQSRNRGIYRVRSLDGTELKVVYCRDKKTLVTVLPYEHEVREL